MMTSCPFAKNSDEKTLKRCRETGEAVKGSSFLFDVQISGSAITYFTQVPDRWDALIITFIGAAESQCAQIEWVDPADASYDQPGMLRDDYYPGDTGFDHLGLKPGDPEELNIMNSKELQNGRLAMLAAVEFLAQEERAFWSTFHHSFIISYDLNICKIKEHHQYQKQFFNYSGIIVV